MATKQHVFKYGRRVRRQYRYGRQRTANLSKPDFLASGAALWDMPLPNPPTFIVSKATYEQIKKMTSDQ